MIDRICKSIDKTKYTEFDYSKGFGKFKVAKLLNDKKVVIREDVIEFYSTLELRTRELIRSYVTKYGSEKEAGFNFKDMAYSEAKKWVEGFASANNLNYVEIVDMIVKYGFEKDEMKLSFIFNVFGDTIIKILNKNLAREHLDNGYIMCECCGKRVKKTNNRVIYCEKCAKKVKNLQNKSYRDNKA